MIDNRYLKQVKEADLCTFTLDFIHQLVLTERRLAALRRTQTRNPDWCAYDPMIGEEVSIDIRIEEQEAVRGELEEQSRLIGVELDRRRGLNQTIRMI